MLETIAYSLSILSYVCISIFLGATKLFELKDKHIGKPCDRCGYSYCHSYEKDYTSAILFGTLWLIMIPVSVIVSFAKTKHNKNRYRVKLTEELKLNQEKFEKEIEQEIELELRKSKL